MLTLQPLKTILRNICSYVHSNFNFDNFAAGNQTFGVRQTADFLEKATWTLAIIILALCILATAFTPTRKQGDNAVLQKLEQTSTNTGAPEFPTTIPGGEAAPVEPVADPAATPAEAE